MKSVRFLGRRAATFAAAAVAAPAVALVATPAFAQATGPDYTALTGAISVDSTVAAILSVGALMVLISLSVMGVRKVISMTRG